MTTRTFDPLEQNNFHALTINAVANKGVKILCAALVALLLLFASLNISLADENFSFIKKDALYMEVREQLIRQEWHAIDYDDNNIDKAITSCLNRLTSGYCTTDKKELSICLQKKSQCAELPELEQCSSDGYCNMIFVHKKTEGKILITTYGDISQPNRNESLYIIGGGLQHD